MDNATETKATLEQAQENVQEMAGEAKRNLKDTAGDAGGRLSQAADQAKATVSQGVDSAQQTIGAALQDSKVSIQDTTVTLKSAVDDPGSLVDDDVKAEALDVKQNIESVMGRAQAQAQTSLAQAKAAPEETVKGVARYHMAIAEGSERVAAADLKRRLDWGEPAFTLVDVRDRQSFDQERIRGAISMPEADLASMASQSLESEREIFIYGETSSQAEQSLLSLKEAGFTQVACIRDGVLGWKRAGGATTGISA
jgi:rhodanese-related sulfurtransferase/ElaB/YqjD/DUF883 family membrane-anchored ribosome-binding protein